MIIDVRSEPFRSSPSEGTHLLVGSDPGGEGIVTFRGQDLTPIARRPRASKVKDLVELRFDLDELPFDFTVSIVTRALEDRFCSTRNLTLRHILRTREFEIWHSEAPDFVWLFDARHFNGIPYTRRQAWQWLDQDPAGGVK